MQGVKAQGRTITCRICGRVIPQLAGKGRLREIHVECGQYESALKRVERFIEHEAIWENAEAMKAQRSQMQAMMNKHLGKSNSRIFNESSDREE